MERREVISKLTFILYNNYMWRLYDYRNILFLKTLFCNLSSKKSSNVNIILNYNYTCERKTYYIKHYTYRRKKNGCNLDIYFFCVRNITSFKYSK